MFKYVVRRFIISILTLFILATATFFLVRILPGDPFSSEKITPEVKKNMMEYYGFDKPLYEQYTRYIGNLLKGDFGTSLQYNGRPVSRIISDTFIYSADLGIRALIFGLVVGLLLGISAALNLGKSFDFLCIFIAIIGVSIPDFIMGPLLQYGFSTKLGWFPPAQWKGFVYTVLPTLTLSFYTLALISRTMRSSMLEIINQDYIMTANAKGISPFKIISSHEVRNAILPIVTILGPVTAAVLTGTFVVESVFAVPGMGKFYVLGIQNLDYTMVLGMTVFYGFFLVTANFIVDIIYGFVDPRIRISGK